MVEKENTMSIPFGPIMSGSLTVILIIFILALLFGVLTQLGWTGVMSWANDIWMLFIYGSVVIGAVLAGLKSGRNGWLTGAGVGVISSVFILLLAFIMGEPVNWPVFLVKIAINAFIGAFGGIIGVNFSS
ncbi:MAG TPA: TIGR04086 family membrane protein [Bacillota bacterium]|nr:TIGR04086 family membrane protein [Bacillota bacterium]